MTTIISSNFYLTSTQLEDNAGIIGYKNLVTPSTITASSETANNPITNAANPATAWGWQSAVADESASISYNDTNYMPSPFDPSGWFGATIDPDLAYTQVTEENPSGEAFVGEFEYVGVAGTATLAVGDYKAFSTGDNLYTCAMVGKNQYQYIRFLVQRAGGAVVSDFRYKMDTNAIGLNTGGAELKRIDINDDWVMLQVKWTVDSDDDYRGSIWCDPFSGPMPVGEKIKMQAAYFGKSSDYPAVIDEGGVKININTQGQEVDYIGIAKHNLNQVGLTMQIKYNGVTVVEPQPVSERQALLFLNNLASPDNVEIIIKGATSPPRIAVLYVGKALRLERNIYVGHTPINYGRQRTAINGVSENGQYLGEIVVRELNGNSVNLQNLTPEWYRTELDPFFKAKPRVPCFWAWRPSKYPTEVGYVWIDGDPSVSNQRSNGMMQASWNFKGFV